MKAIQTMSFTGPDALKYVELDRPVPGTDQLLIQVKAVGVSFADLLKTQGLHHNNPSLPFIPGSDVAGVIIDSPSDSSWSVGDRVVTSLNYGGFAEYVAVDSQMLLPIPEQMSFIQAANMALNYLTMHFAFTARGQLSAGDSVVIHGAAGGIGESAIHLARALGAAQIIAITSTEDKGKFAVTAGADEFVLVDNFKAFAQARGVADIVVDPVGGERFTDSLRCLKANGRVLVIGFTSGLIPDVKVNRLLLNNISIVGVAWSDELFYTGYVKKQWDEILSLVQFDSSSYEMGTTIELRDASEALRMIGARQAKGKIVVLP